MDHLYSLIHGYAPVALECWYFSAAATGSLLDCCHGLQNLLLSSLGYFQLLLLECMFIGLKKSLICCVVFTSYSEKTPFFSFCGFSE